MESINLTETEQSPIQILEGYSDGYSRAKFHITTVDVSNRNGRTYPRSLAERETSMMFAGRVLGQSKHPQSEPDILDQFIVWESAILEGDEESFIAKIIPTQKGKDFIEIAKAGAMVSTSRRGTGELREGTDKNGKKTKIVVPETYQLIGADVLYPGVQSNVSSMHTIHFESIAQSEETNMELTLETLREDHGELVTEIETAVATPLQEKVTELEGQVTALTQEKADAVALAEQTQKKFASVEEANKSLNEQVEQLNTAIADLTAKVNEATASVTALNEQIVKLEEAGNARNHLLEKVKGERAAWLILDELKNETTVADVDAKFDEAKRKCDALIEHAAPVNGRAQYLGNENSELDNPDKTAQEAEAAKAKAILEKSKRLANYGGF